MRTLIRSMALASVLFAAGCGGDESHNSPTQSSTAPSEASIKRAYTMKCSLCHGTDGKLMASKAPDLSISTMSVEERIAIITYGKGTMPPQKDILDAATIRGIAEYIERFRDTP
jgi:mono/diheme cytochrome c family protein